MKQCTLYLVACTLLLVGVAVAEQQHGEPILLSLKDGNVAVLDSVINRVTQNGGRILHIYPPHVLIGFLPTGTEASIKAKVPGLQSYRGEIVGEDVQQLGETFSAVFEAWNNNFHGKAKSRGLDPSPGEYTPPEPTADAFAVPPDAITQGGSPLNRPQGTGYYDVSEFLYGRISVNVILPESDGSIDTQTENWNSTREQQVVSEIQQGLNWLASQDARANLTFVYHFYFGRTDSRAQTGYEPISRPSTQQHLWMNQIMSNFWYTNGSEFDRAFAFLNTAIAVDNTDWSVLIWVVDSQNDPDGRFSDGKFAYAYLGGPFLVMTYDNDLWGIGKMDAVVSHEFEHNFHALDEYANATNQPCTMYSGYLNVQNRNSANYQNCGSDLNLACVMRSGDNVSGICTYTRQMIGWRDTDNNGILDVADTYPNTVLNPLVPNPIYDKTPTFTGSGADVALTNLNPYPFGHWGAPRNNISPNPVNQWWWRVDAGGWNVWYGEYLGPMTTNPLPDGPHAFEFKARNALGRFDPTPELQNFTTLGHLKSTTNRVSAANSQRKLARAADGTYHLVYEDENLIYYSTSTNNGASWSTEEVLSHYSPSSYPAIVCQLGHVFVVWQEYEGFVEGMHQYRIRGVWKQPGSSWNEIMSYSGPPILARFSSQVDAVPVIVAAENTFNEHQQTNPVMPELMLAWRGPDGIYSAVGNFDVIPGCCGPGEEEESQSQVYLWNPSIRFGRIPGTSSSSIRPSLGTDFSSRVGLTYQDNNMVYAMLNDGAGWSVSELVSTPVFEVENNQTPSLAVDNLSRLIVAWDYFDGETIGTRIKVRRRETNGNWGVATSFSGVQVSPYVGGLANRVPSVSGYPRYNSDYGVTWQTSQNTVQLKKNTGGVWGASQIVGNPGYDPNLSSNESTSLDALIGYRNNNNAPYALAFTSQYLPNSPLELSEDIYREVRVAGDSFAVRLRLGDLNLRNTSGNEAIDFSGFPDTTVVYGTQDLRRVFRTEPFTIGTNSSLDFTGMVRVLNSSWVRNNWSNNTNITLAFEAVDNASGLVLGRPLQYSISRNRIPSVSGSLSVSLTALAGRTVYLRAGVSLSNDLSTRVYVVDERIPRDGSMHPMAKVGENGEPEIPIAFVLDQNFPNPFNPSTQIRFGLPNAAVVRLTVFDVLGRELQTLSSGYFGAGYHTVVWDASDFASGVYFARMTVNDETGKQTFTKTNRLLLTK